MRGLVTALAVVAAVLIILGLVLKALKWLIILGVVALIAAVVLGFLKGRRALR